MSERPRDPGWGSLSRAILAVFMPGAAARTAGATGPDALVALRSVWLSLTLAPFLILLVLILIRIGLGEVQAGPFLAILCVAVVSSLLARWARRRLFNLNEPSRLVGAYRTSFFLSFALSEAGLLIGFVASFLLPGLWAYLVVLPFHTVNMALLAPTRSNLEKIDRELRARGVSASLYEAISEPRPNGPER